VGWVMGWVGGWVGGWGGVGVLRLMRMTFSCWKCCRILISRSVRFVSVRCSKALLIFLIATFSPVVLSMALHTTPYAPWPMGLSSV